MSRRRARWVRCSSASASSSRAELGDAIADLAAIELQARLARPLAADAAALAILALSLLAQARNQVLQPDDLDLRLGGARAGVAAKDLQDHGRPVQHLDPGRLLQVARLRRRDVVVDQHRLDRRRRRHAPGRGRAARRKVVDLAGDFTPLAVVRVAHDVCGALRLVCLRGDLRGRAAGQRGQVGQLATAEQRRRMQRLAPLGHGRHHVHAQRAPQPAQLGQRGGEAPRVDAGKLNRDHGGAKRDGRGVGHRAQYTGSDGAAALVRRPCSRAAWLEPAAWLKVRALE